MVVSDVNAGGSAGYSLSIRGQNGAQGAVQFLGFCGSTIWLTPWDHPSTWISTNTWTHIAVVRSGATTSLYVNGVLRASQAGTGGAITAGSGNTGIGRTSGYNNGFYAGYIDELRVSRVARYTGPFTPPTAAFPSR